MAREVAIAVVSDAGSGTAASSAKDFLQLLVDRIGQGLRFELGEPPEGFAGQCVNLDERIADELVRFFDCTFGAAGSGVFALCAPWVDLEYQPAKISLELAKAPINLILNTRNSTSVANVSRYEVVTDVFV